VETLGALKETDFDNLGIKLGLKRKIQKALEQLSAPQPAKLEPEIEEKCYGIVEEFKAPKIDGIEVYGFSGKALRDGFLDTSPFVRKIETYLELAGADYTKLEANVQKAPRGKIPYINFKGLCVSDSHEIIKFLKNNKIDLDKGRLNKKQLQISHIVRTIMENSLYFASLHSNFSHEEQAKLSKKQFTAGKGFLYSAIVPGIIQSSIQKTLYNQGYGRYPDAEIVKRGIEDLNVVENLIVGPFLFGEEPVTADAIIFAFVGFFFRLDDKFRLSPLFQHLKKEKFPKVGALCDAVFDRVVKKQPKLEEEENK